MPPRPNQIPHAGRRRPTYAEPMVKPCPRCYRECRKTKQGWECPTHGPIANPKQDLETLGPYYQQVLAEAKTQLTDQQPS